MGVHHKVVVQASPGLQPFMFHNFEKLPLRANFNIFLVLPASTINDKQLTPPPARYNHTHPYFLRQTLFFLQLHVYLPVKSMCLTPLLSNRH